MDARRQKRKAWLWGAVIALVVAVALMNTYAGEYWQRQKAARRQMVAERTQAETQAKLEAEGRIPKSVFELPEDSGPDDAPVQLTVFINSSNDCLPPNAELLQKVQEVYGELVSIRYLDMIHKEVQRQADERQLGCDAGIYFNGELRRKAQPGNIVGVREFMGAVDTDRFYSCDVYGAVNYILDDKGRQVPEAARKLAEPPPNLPPLPPPGSAPPIAHP